VYELLGISLVLAALLTINALASLAAAGLWSLIERPMRGCSARTRAEVLFAMRVGPPTFAVISVAALLIPSYIVYEPYSTNEFVGKKLGALAIVSAVGLTLAFWRGFRSWLATRSLLRKWLDAATPIQLAEIDVRTFRMPHSFPIIAVVGMFRPRLFIAERVIESLSQEEMVAAIAHECGHLAARDNLRRTLIRVCRDMLAIIPSGRSIDRAWSENAEAAADEYAADRGSAVALNLASALIEIARMVPAGARPSMPAGAFILGDETHGVMGRVNRLLALAVAGRRQPKPIFISWAERIGLSMLLGALILALTNTHLLASVHVAMEHVVQALT
jgi:Zn-dependent protease with chaperone function